MTALIFLGSVFAAWLTIAVVCALTVGRTTRLRDRQQPVNLDPPTLVLTTWRDAA